MVPPLAVLCVDRLARFPDQLPHQRRIHPSPALLDAFADTRDPLVWATVAQLVHPLPARCHDLALPLAHPALARLQNISDSPDFSLVTILSLPNCVRLRDDDLPALRALHRLLALDLRGCSISSRALAILARDGPPLRLRLLSLHGCPNIADDALSALVPFPLLSVIDLRFTRCTPSAVKALLAPLGFHPADNSSLFHPAPPALAVCALEKLARSIPLYSCPPQSVFRLHINDLRLPSRSKKVDKSPSPSAIRTISSAEDTVVFLPPLRNISDAKPSAAPIPRSIDPPTIPDYVSNASSFYETLPPQNKPFLPFSAQAVQPSERGKLDPLAIARSPPPWTVLHPRASDDVQKALPVAHHPGQALDKPLQVDRARLHKRSSHAVANLVHQSTKKHLKIESEFALEKSRAVLAVKSRNPFIRSIKSVFIECDTSNSSSSNSAKPDKEMRTSRSLPSRIPGQQEKRTIKPLKPITTLRPPTLPKELLPSTRQASKPGVELKQARLSFS